MAQKEKLSQRVLLEILTEEIEKLRTAKEQIDQALIKNKQYLEEIRNYTETLENARKRLEKTELKVKTDDFNQVFDEKMSELKETLSEQSVFPAGGTVAFFLVFIYAIVVTLMVLGFI